MDPIERLNLYMSMWEQWVKSYKSYKYHGQNMRCKSKLLYVPISISFLSSKVPPIYYQYHFTVSESFGYVNMYLRKNLVNAVVFGDNCMYFQTYGTRLPYDWLFIDVVRPKTNGSFSCSLSYEEVSTCRFSELSYKYNYSRINWGLYSPLTSISGWVGKYGYLGPPDYIDTWWYRALSPQLSHSYVFNWRYYPISGKYDIWDSEGYVELQVSLNILQFLISSYWFIKTYNYVGSCYKYLKVLVSGVVVYQDVFFPLP